MSIILIAEDNAVNRELLHELLETRGHTVLEACNGQEALDILEKTKPDLLLLDIGMPDLSGHEVAIELRRKPWGAGICLIALTGWGGDDDRRRAGCHLGSPEPVKPE